MRRWLMVALLLSGGCSSHGSGGGGGGGGSHGNGGGSSGSGGGAGGVQTYDLVSATGQWSLTGTAGGCRQTTSSVLHLASMTGGISSAVFISPTFTAVTQLSETVDARAGQDTCSGASMVCPFSPDSPQTTSVALSFSLDGAATAASPPNTVVVPTFTLDLPQLCDGQSYDVSPGALRGKPLTLAALASGKFTVEGSGSAPIAAQTPDVGEPDPLDLTGTLTWSFSFVFQSATFDPANTVTPPALTTYDQCLLDFLPDSDSLEAASAAVTGGQTDVPLNATGCRRVKLSGSGGTTEIDHVLTTGTDFGLDSSGNPTASPRTLVTFSQIVDSNGVHERVTDFDGGALLTDCTFDPGGSWSGTVEKQQLADGTVVRQVEAVPGDAGLETVTVKTLVAGALVADDSYETSIDQQSCFDPSSADAPGCSPGTGGGGGGNCGGATALCMGTQLTQVKQQLDQALKKGSACLDKLGVKLVGKDGKAASMVATGKLTLYCDTNPCDEYGHYDTEGAKNGAHNLTVNVAKNNPSQLASTLFHEMLHSAGDTFRHNDPQTDASSHACKLNQIDRTYACEALCFNPAPTSCQCNRCLTPDSPTSVVTEPSDDTCTKCSGLGACGNRTDSSGNLVPAALGAWCDRLKTFCDTKTECDSACAAIGGTCKRFRNTCNKMCN